MNEEQVSKSLQKCFGCNPTIILGSGASMHHGLPSMSKLSKYLQKKLKTNGKAEEDAWLLIKAALANDDHLEAALENNRLPDTLLSKILNLTWQCVNKKDINLLDTAARSLGSFPLGELLSGMFKSTIRKINIVTTNYDRVAEYACNSKGILYQTGFAPGYVQKWEGNTGVKFQHGNNASRVVKIWKVHGSLDWFRAKDNQVIGLPLFHLNTDAYDPLIVTPGFNKFERTHEEPFRTIINGADDALKNADAFLCVGFGFRDQHIHPKIVERCRNANVPIVVLAQRLTDEAKSFLKDKAGNNYVGIEESTAGSKVFTPKNPDGIDIEKENLWSLDGFNELTL